MISGYGTSFNFNVKISICLMAEGGKALAAGLKGNQVLTELNVAGNNLAILADRSALDVSVNL